MNLMRGVTLLALAGLVARQANLGVIIAQERAVLPQPAFGMRHCHFAVAPVTEIRLDVTSKTDRPADRLGGLAVLGRPWFFVRIDNRFMAFSARGRALVGLFRPVGKMAPEAWQRYLPLIR